MLCRVSDMLNNSDVTNIHVDETSPMAESLRSSQRWEIETTATRLRADGHDIPEGTPEAVLVSVYNDWRH